MKQAKIRIVLAACAVAGMSSVASAQQVGDPGLFSNKDWNSGSNPGFVLSGRNSGTIPELRLNIRENTQAAGTRRDTPWTRYERNQWAYLAFNVDQTTGTSNMFIDGVLASTITLPAVGSSFGNFDTFQLGLDLNLGQDGTGTYNNNIGFKALLDDAAIWRRAVSPAEIQSIYNAGVGATPTSLSSLVGSTPSLGNDLVALYSFEGNADDVSGSTNVNNGTWAGSGAAYGTGLFGQAADLVGSNYVTLGDAAAFPEDFKFGTESFTFGVWVFETGPTPPPPPTFASFTGASPANNLASNPGNWSFIPANWSTVTEVTVSNGTTAADPAVFDASFGSQFAGRILAGAAGVETNIRFETGAELILRANPSSVIGQAGTASDISVVNLDMTGGSISVWGGGEETTRFIVGANNNTTNINMTGASEFNTGPRVADAAHVIGFRRPLADGSDGVPRLGDDIFLADGSNHTTNFTMSGSSMMYVTDVLYPGENTGAVLNFVQNDNSRVLVGWDTRWNDDGHNNTNVINWTMNDSSQFVVGLDHALGETGGSGGVINLTVNDNAYFAAGGRIFLGAGFEGGTVNMTVNGGEVRVGIPGQVDNTGSGTFVPVVDSFMVMGGGARTFLNVNGGAVNIGRNLYVGQTGGEGTVNLDGGSINILGIAPTGLQLGNTPDTIPSTDFLGGTEWLDNGGDLFIATQFWNTDPKVGGRIANRGSFNVSGTGTLSVARDVFVGGAGEFGEFTVRGGSATVSVGGSLNFGALPLAGGIAGDNSEVRFGAKITGSSHTSIAVGSDVRIFNDASLNLSSVLDASIDVTYDIYRPTTGDSFQLISYAGTRTGEFASVTASDIDGIDWVISYDDSAKTISLVAQTVYVIGDADRDGDVDFSDLLTVAQNYNNTVDMIWATGDFTNDSAVSFPDLLGLAQNYNFGTNDARDFASDWALALSLVPEPTTLVGIGAIGMLLARRRRA